MRLMPLVPEKSGLRTNPLLCHLKDHAWRRIRSQSSPQTLNPPTTQTHRRSILSPQKHPVRLFYHWTWVKGPTLHWIIKNLVMVQRWRVHADRFGHDDYPLALEMSCQSLHYQFPWLLFHLFPVSFCMCSTPFVPLSIPSVWLESTVIDPHTILTLSSPSMNCPTDPPSLLLMSKNLCRFSPHLLSHPGPGNQCRFGD